MTALRMFIPITKVDAAQRTVYGIATGETVDRSGEICDYATTKPLYEAWSGDISKASGGKSLGNLRAMHGKVAAGKVTAITFNDAAKQIEIAAKVVDDAEWAKVEEGVYTGFSQGGAYAKRWKDDAGRMRYTAEPSEVSLVDLPCLPSATFQVVKAAGSVETKHFATVVDVKPTNAEVNAKAVELAKAAGRENDVTDFFEPAREALVKAALPPVPEAPAGEVASQAEPVTPPAPGDGVQQMWVAKDGSTHAKKADALAKNVEIDAAASVAPGTKPVLDALADLGGKLGITKAGEPTPDPPASPPAEAPVADALSKSMYTVSSLADAISSLTYIRNSVTRSMSTEMATKANGVLGTACDLLVAMATETAAQLTQPDGAAYAADLYMAAGVTVGAHALGKVAEFAADKPVLAKLLPELEKAGARNSKADASKIQSMHDSAVSLGAACSGASKAADGDLAKALTEMTAGRDAEKARGDALQKTMDEQILPMLKTIAERVENIEKQPLPLPLQGGATRTVSKGGAEPVDSADLAAQLTKLREDDPGAFSVLMIKAAQATPQQLHLSR